MKFGQLIDYNMRIIFIEKWYTECDGETIPIPFYEKLKSGSKVFKVLRNLFLLYAKPRTIEIFCNQATYHLPLPLIKLFFFFKKKRDLELVFLPYFLHNVWRKIFLLIYSINWPSFIVWLSLLREILGNMCTVIVC